MAAMNDESELKFKIPAWVIGMIIAFVALLAYISAGEALRDAMPVVVYVAAGVIILVIVIKGIAVCYENYERLKTLRVQYQRDRQIAEAEGMRAEAQAAKERVLVITAPKGHQVVVRDPNEKSTYRQLHLNAKTVVNGHIETPTDLEIELYRQFQGQVSGNEPLVIDQPPDVKTLDQYKNDWFETLILSAPHVHYCGATRSGKTTLANFHLSRIQQVDPQTEFYLLNPKDTAARKPFVIEPDFKDIEQAIEGLQTFNTLMLKRKNDPALSQSSHKIVFVIDEWDWIYQVYGTAATRLLIPLVKVGAELKIKVILIGQSPLTGDTGLSQSFYHNMVRVAIWQEGARLLNNYPLDKRYKAPLMVQYEQLKEMAPSYEREVGSKLRYCVTVPMAGNPSVEVIPYLADSQPIKQQEALPTTIPSPDEMKVFQAWKVVMGDSAPSWNKVHHKVVGKVTNCSKRDRLTYVKTFEKYGISHRLSG